MMRSATTGFLIVPAAVALLATTAASQQPNTPQASMTFAGVDGPTYPITLPVNLSALGPAPFMTVRVGGAPQMPFAVCYFPQLLAAGIPMPGLGIIDGSLSGFGLALDGIGLTPAGPDPAFLVPASGPFTVSMPLSSSTPALDIVLQGIVQDATQPSGLRLTAATRLIYIQNPQPGYYVAPPMAWVAGQGTPLLPFSTIEAGLNASAADPNHPPVYVASGAYAGAFPLRDGISIFGGRHPQLWHEQLGQPSIVDAQGSSFIATGHTLASTLRNLEFRGGVCPPNPGWGSIAVQVRSSSGALRFEHCRFIADTGRDGSAGAAGANGQSGDAGGAGGNGGFDLAGSAGARGGSWGFSGGNGGTGGLSSFSGGAGESGSHGGWAMVGQPTPGGSGGNCSTNPNSNGGHGQSGSTSLYPGTNGSDGSPGSSHGVIVTGSWDTAWGSSGGMGERGRGGAGGGGGGGRPEMWAICLGSLGGGGGGGGGQGGGGGSGGSGGQQGGCSFAVFTYDSSPHFANCVFDAGTAGQGGPGGAGGWGGLGGAGGAGGIGASSWYFGFNQAAGNGGAGGQGKWGGNGGRGGDGAGGPSWCVFRAGTVQPPLANFLNPVFLLGQAGQGAGTAPAGSSGTVY